MSNNAFYVYGVVKFGINLYWQEKGIAEKNVYMISEGNFSALVHECEDKAYSSKNPEEIKEMVLTHNKILDKAIEDFDGVIPLSFNTIIKEGTNSAYFNLKKWLNDEQGRLERIWNKIKGKREYGLRVYYEKEKLLQEGSENEEVKEIEKDLEGKGQGLSYLLQSKAKTKSQEIFQSKLNNLKQEFFDSIKKITKDLVISPSRISLEEEKDLLLSLSVLVKEGQIGKIKRILEKEEAKGFSFHLAGPFSPYSFVENGRK